MAIGLGLFYLFLLLEGLQNYCTEEGSGTKLDSRFC